MADELEKLYVDIGQWRQTIEDADRLEKSIRTGKLISSTWVTSCRSGIIRWI